ncbi:hypothetical protein ACFQ67_03395 [Streptomyces sp. NPDC056488]|uniref:hypothetical protein n=1 Tax=unclassified Streptomyces TaxID=2593676 RepID=UPI0036CCFA10
MSPVRNFSADQHQRVPCKALRCRTAALDCEARILGTTAENRIQHVLEVEDR